MPANRRPIVLGAILVVLLAVLAWRQFGGARPSEDAGSPAATSAAVLTPASRDALAASATGGQAAAGPGGAVAGRTGVRGSGAGRMSSQQVQDVDLGKLTAARSEPAPAARNLFRFQPKAPPPPPPGYTPPQPVALVPAVPPPPPPPPPIPLKLIGIIDGARGGKIAVLTDNASRGDTFYGQEGDVIDGRYRIVKIGVESVDMEYVDGRGRQPIRLSGQ